MTADPIRAKLAAVDSWADVLALKAALVAMLDLHRPTTLQAVAVGCQDEWNYPTCDHDDECPLEDVTVCRHCVGIAEEVDEERSLVKGTEYPCPTVRDIAAALGVLPVEES